MSKRLFKTLVAVLAIAAAAAGPVRGQNASPNVTLDFTSNTWGLPTSNTMATESYTDGTYSITLSATYAYKFTSGYLLLGKSGSYLQLPAFSSPVEKIEVVGKSGASGNVNQNIYVGGTAVSTQTTGAAGTNTYVINENYRAAGNIYTLKVENAYNTQITYIKVYYVSSGGGSGSETTTTYNVTFGGFSNPNMNTTVSVASLPQTFTGVGGLNFYPFTVLSNGGDFTSASVTSGGDGKVSPNIVAWNQMTITVTGTFEGTATIHVEGHDNNENPVSCDITVACALPPVPITVRMAAGTEDAANWSIASGNASVPGNQVLENVMSGSEVTATYNGTTKKVKSVKAVKYVPPVLVQSIVLDKQTASLGKDSTMTLSVASVLPENAADKSYTWSSDNTSVAIVNATTGVVTGMAAGTANIIATANDGSGVKDTCVVTVIVLQSVTLDGVAVLYASDNDIWSTVMGYNPGLMYQDDDDYVRLTSNNAVLFYLGYPVYVDDNAYPSSNDYQWLFVINMYGGDFYYRQGETWQDAIDANRMVNQDWSSEGGKVKLNGNMILIDNSNYEPVAPTATIDPTVSYSLSMDN